MSQNILLIGFMGSGKSTVSELLAQKLNMTEVDTDALIVQREGRSIQEIFDTDGENYFRNCETELLKEFSEKSGYIISCGGGMALREQNAALMKETGHVILLTATPDTIYERVKNSNERPLLKGNMNVAFITELMEKRREKYLNAANTVIETDDKLIDLICDEIIAKFDENNKN